MCGLRLGTSVYAQQRNGYPKGKEVLFLHDLQRAKENASTKKELTRTEKRLQKLDNLFAKMYDDRAKETIIDRNFAMLDRPLIST